MLQSDHAKQQLHGQLIGPEAALKCALKWREDCARVSVFGSAIWMPSPSHFGSKRRRLSPDDDDVEMAPAPASGTPCNPTLHGNVRHTMMSQMKAKGKKAEAIM